MQKALLDDEREKRMTEDIWLNYLNRYLFETGTISEKEYKNNCPVQTMNFERKSRVAKGHKTSVRYIFNLTA